MNIYLFIASILILTYFLGIALERFRIPWIFSALILGVGLAVYNPVANLTNSETFIFLSQLGMYFLLFLIGLEIDIKQFTKKGSFIIKSAFFVVFLEVFFGSNLIHFFFKYDWSISFLVSLSFATVGEAILIPILHEFNLINTPLGQTIIGIGTADDIIEITSLILAGVLVGTQIGGNIWLTLAALALLFVMSIGLVKIKSEGTRFKLANVETIFLIVLFVLFTFLGIGIFAAAAPLAAFLAGISIKSFLPHTRFKFIENEINSLAYGFFAPLFFVSVGTELNVRYLLYSPLLILLIVIVSNLAKILGSLIIGRKELGTKGSILLGIGLSVRFSSSIIIIKFLFDHSIIDVGLYSALVSSSIIFNFLLPIVFSKLLVRWKFVLKKETENE